MSAPPAYRLHGRIETLGPDDYTATATALPENGDPSEVRSVTQTLDSREAADQALDELMARIEDVIERAGGVVIERRKIAV
jgi:trehalose-6-phosphatase